MSRIHAHLVLVLCLLLAAPAMAANTLVEDFTTTTLRDSFRTTAEWNTGTGELRLFPFAPSQVGSFNTPGKARDVAVDGTFAYVADQTSGLQVLDITDRSNPVLLGTLDTPVAALGVAVAGDLVLIADSSTGLLTIDVSDPTNPNLLGTFDTPGFASDVEIAGDVAYVADYSGDLQVISIADPTAPAGIGSLSTPGNVDGIAVAGDLAFLADENFGLRVVDITDPSNPISIGFLDTPGSALGIAVAGDYAFVADGGAGLRVVDISDPTSPVQVGFFDTPSTAYEVAVQGDRAYVADRSSGLQILDISDPTSPALVHTHDTPSEARAVQVVGSLAFVADENSGLQIVEVLDLLTPEVRGESLSSDFGIALAVSGDHAFVGTNSPQLRIVDISDPHSPTPVGVLMIPAKAFSIAVEGDLLLVGDGASTLRVFDITDPLSPSAMGSLGLFDRPVDIVISGNLAYISEESTGLRIVDISDPTAPVSVGSYSTPGEVFGVAVVGDLVYLAATSDGLEIVDASDPTSPSFVGGVALAGSALQVEVAGDVAYIAAGTSGLHIFDISNPSAPSFLSSIPFEAQDLALAGDRVHVAAGAQGFYTGNIADPTNVFGAELNFTPNLGSSITLDGPHAYLVGSSNGFRMVQVGQDEVIALDLRGQSVAFVDGDDTVVRTRISADQTGDITWRVSDSSSIGFQNIPLDTWTVLSTPRDRLIWQSLHFWAPGVNPTAREVTIDWLFDEPAITSISDVPNDQGRQVSLEWRRSGYDFVGDPSQIVEYAVYRQIDPALKTGGVEAGGSGPAQLPADASKLLQAHAASGKAAGWHFVTTVPVRAQDDYAVVVPTLADSTEEAGLYESTFMVSALTATPGVFFDSNPFSGFSLDNLAPGIPQNLVAGASPSGTSLDWDDSIEEDFRFYRVYRGSDPGFTPAPGNLLSETAASSFEDDSPDPLAPIYKVSAVDFAGNEGEPASVEMTATDANVAPRRQFMLGNAVPNPFNPSTRISFELARGGRVQLEVIDVAGRVVATLIEDHRVAGPHSVMWNGTDAAGQRVASGVYHYRLVTADGTRTRRMTLVK